MKVEYSNLFDPQYEVGITINDTQKNFQTHTHDYIEIACQLRGSILHIINGQTYQVDESQFIIIRPSDTHQNIQSDSLSIVILISEKYLNSVVIESAFDPIVLFIKDYLLSGAPHAIPMTTEMARVLNALYQNHIKSNSAYYLKQRTLISQFILEFEHISDLEVTKQSEDALISYIYKHIKKATLAGYAKHIHYSATTTGEKIKELYGVNFSTLLKTIRINLAADLLLNSSLTIEQIMEEVGYSNKTYFYAVFKQKYNMSPATFRRNQIQITSKRQ